MRDRVWIAAGLVLFVGLVTFPFWHYLADGQALPPDLKLSLPASEKECVAPIAVMKSSHAKLLGEWRDLVVRQNIRTYTAYNGRILNISLTGTCLQQCHADKAAFCDRCHDYSGIPGLYCWDCHVDPKSVRQAAATSSAAGTGEEHGLR